MFVSLLLIFFRFGPGIKINFMPWVKLCKSDLRKITLNEECVSASNSVERATFFFNHVLLIDFPADVFLNRPTTIKVYVLEVIFTYPNNLYFLSDSF